MPVVTLRQESLEQGHFYVPQFEVKIAGANLPRDVLRDVIQLTYKDNIKEIDSFELTVNNWDPSPETSNTLARRPPSRSRTIRCIGSSIRATKRSKCGWATRAICG